MARRQRDAAKGGAVLLLGEMSDPPTADENDALVQARAIGAVLEGRGTTVTQLTIGLDLAAAVARLKEHDPAFAINLVEQVAGSGRLVALAPMLLDHLGIPYSGAGAAALALTTDKPGAKRLLRDAGLPTPDWRLPGETPDPAQATTEPWIVKSCFEEASIGLDAATALVGQDRIEAAFAARAGKPGHPWFAERYIEGREFNLALLGTARDTEPRPLPVSEIRFVDFPADRPHIVDYAAKWDEGSFAYRHTPRHFPEAAADRALIAEIEALGLSTWRLFGLAGYARVDFRVDAAGRPWILEVNANPCLSPDAGFAAAAAKAGIAYEALIEAILPKE